LSDLGNKKRVGQLGPMRTGAAIAIAAVVAGVVGVLIGVLVALDIASGREAPVTGPYVCAPDADLLKAFDELKQSSGLAGEEIDAIRLDIEGLGRRLTELKDARPVGGELAVLLPPPYVDKVIEFFESQAPKSLLSAKVKDKPGIFFGRPAFIDAQTISAPYYFEEEEHYLLLEITILDYHELKFDLLWDSYVQEQR